MMRNPYPTAAGASTLPPGHPWGTAQLLKGKSLPLPLGLGVGWVTLHPCCSRGIWGAGSQHLFLPASQWGFFCTPSLSTPSPAHCVPSAVLHPSLSFSLQCFQQNSFLASHCRLSASTPPGPAHTDGAGLPLPELLQPPPCSQPAPHLRPLPWHQPSLGTQGQGVCQPSLPRCPAGCPASIILANRAASHVWHPCAWR